MADLIRLDITVAEDDVDIATMIMAQQLAYGWEEDTLPTGEQHFRVHIEHAGMLQTFLAELNARLPEAEIERTEVPQQDWTVAWRDFFTPVKVGSRFMVIAPWMEEDVDLEGRTSIVIEPKTAFGTGHHPTTALCLACVSDLADAGRFREGMRYFDIGTGSGILSIGCAKMGLTGMAVDIDVLAVENTEENKIINGVVDAVEVAEGSADYTEEKFDVVLANILAEPLKMLCPDILARRKEDGCLVLSGLLESQADSVEAVYREAGMPEARRVIQGEWAALIWE